MDYPVAKKLGPLAGLAGVWEGDKGEDLAPSSTRSVMTTPFRERMRFEPMGLIDNHRQQLYGLRYSPASTANRRAWRQTPANDRR